MENPIKMDDLGVALFSETSIYIIFPKGGKKSTNKESIMFETSPCISSTRLVQKPTTIIDRLF